MFFLTSVFLVCCELYGWTTSGSRDGQKHKENSNDSSENDVNSSDIIQEEDFPTLSEWLDDRDILYMQRLR